MNTFLTGENSAGWEDLGHGAPTIIAFARLCSEALCSEALCSDALASGRRAPESLSEEARAILGLAATKGAIEIKGTYNAFEAPERFLAVHVETEDGDTFIFRSRRDPRLTIRCLEGFRQLCAAGLVMHHLYCDFSLTTAGFDLARTLRREDLQVLETLAAENQQL